MTDFRIILSGGMALRVRANFYIQNRHAVFIFYRNRQSAPPQAVASFPASAVKFIQQVEKARHADV